MKMLQSSKIIGKGYSSQAADILFCKYKIKGSNKMDVSGFQSSLESLAKESKMSVD